MKVDIDDDKIAALVDAASALAGHDSKVRCGEDVTVPREQLERAWLAALSAVGMVVLRVGFLADVRCMKVPDGGEIQRA